MKKEKSPVVVILCIIFLSLFIILPPTFRKLIPKQTISNNQNQNDIRPKLIIINCNKIFVNEMYQVNSKTKYVDNVPTNTVTYQKITSLPDNYTQTSNNETTTAEEEIAHFKSLVNINEVSQETTTRFVIDSNLISSNPADKMLVNYLSNSPDSQKLYFESIGYTCNRMES